MKTFYTRYRLDECDLPIDFKANSSYVGSQSMMFYPYFISYEIGYIQHDTIVYIRIGPLDRIPLQRSDGAYYANFIVDKDWCPGLYMIRWKYKLSASSGLEEADENFTVLESL